MQAANFEVVNSAVNRVFTNTADDDLCIYTDCNYQRVHIGCGSNSASSITVNTAGLTVNGNLGIQGILSTSNTTLVTSGFKIGKPVIGGGSTTITQQVTSIAGLNNNFNNYAFQLSNLQTDYRFLNASGGVVAALSNNGNITLSNNVSIGGTLTVGGSATFGGNIIANNISDFAMVGRNRIINGDMRINQRGATSAVVNSGNLTQFAVDRWYTSFTGGTHTNTVSQCNINFATDGYQFAYRTQITTLGAYDTTTGTANICEQAIEGFNAMDLQWGTANAKSASVSFSFATNYTSQSYCLAIRSSNNDRSFVIPFTPPAANTWQRYTYTIPGPTSGTFTYANNIGLKVGIFAGGGSGVANASASNNWYSGNAVAITSANGGFTNTVGNYVMITGFQFEKGATATSFEYRPYGLELQLCQRYYYISPGIVLMQHSTSTNFGGVQPMSVFFPCEMRIAPTTSTITLSSIGGTGWITSAANLIVTGSTRGTQLHPNGSFGGVGTFNGFIVNFNAEF